MHHTRIDIPEKARRKLAIELNARLADAIDLKFQAKHAHWNVKGPRFIALRKSIGVAQKQGDDGTADLFTSISQEIDKSLWLLEAHLQAET